ncbi:MAG TPA: molybdopterin molybdotransferase MoeA [Pseudomonadota bacterium]|nr:molybdopterin molybdotransferase MoeA [Pseudomonadota bacterium]
MSHVHSPAGGQPVVPELLSPEAALALILHRCGPLGGEVVELSAALGRVLREPVKAGRCLPPWDSSAMDGYAVRAGEVQLGQPLPVVGVIAAGHPATAPLAPGTVMRIMTGAPLPAGADAVIMKEEADEQAGAVRFRQVPTLGQHLRRAGEDIADGEVVLPAGALLGPGELGLLAALGRTILQVHRRPQVAIVSTGDELVTADVAPGPGQIVNSNAHALLAQVTEAGAVGRVLPIAADDRDAIAACFAEAARADVVISSGGVSVGEFDYVREGLAMLGAVEQFSKVAMRPGKPLQFLLLPRGPGAAPGVEPVSRGPEQLVFGLPGNPASSMVSFELFVRPALRRLLGLDAAALLRPLAPVRLLEPILPDRSRLHFMRALVSRSVEEPAVLLGRAPRHQGSGMLRSMVGVNALLHVPPGPAALPAGATVFASLLQPV